MPASRDPSAFWGLYSTFTLEAVLPPLTVLAVLALRDFVLRFRTEFFAFPAFFFATISPTPSSYGFSASAADESVVHLDDEVLLLTLTRLAAAFDAARVFGAQALRGKVLDPLARRLASRGFLLLHGHSFFVRT